MSATTDLTDLDRFVDAYIECALWSSTDNAENPLDDNFDETDLAPETLATMRADCADFIESQADLLAQADSAREQGYAISTAGFDFWLTRNGHGAGFWDRGLGEVGDRLSDAAKAYGTSDLYVGDDGKVYA